MFQLGYYACGFRASNGIFMFNFNIFQFCTSQRLPLLDAKRQYKNLMI